MGQNIFYQVVLNYYYEQEKLVASMFDFVEEFEVDKKAVLENFKYYTQGILYKVALADYNFKEEEKELILKIGSGDCWFSFDEEGSKKVDEMLEEIPSFVKLSVAADKKMNSLLKTMDPTYCQRIYDYLRRITNYLKFVDDELKVVEDTSSKELIQPIRQYYLHQYVRFAPRRKE